MARRTMNETGTLTLTGTHPMTLKCGQKVSIRASFINDLEIKASASAPFPTTRHLGPSSGFVQGIKNDTFYYVVHDSDQSTGIYLRSELRDPQTGQPFDPKPQPHPTPPPTPNLDQLRLLRHDIFTLTEFLDWLANNHYSIVLSAFDDDGNWIPILQSQQEVRSLIDRSLVIDPRAIDAERHALAEYQRQLDELPQEEF